MKRPSRPASVTWLAVAVLCLAGINAARAVVTSAQWDLWIGFDLPSALTLPLRVALSAVWAMVLAALAWGLWALRHRARRWQLPVGA